MSLPSNANDQKLSIMLANYRHRFERSINFKKLQWYSNNLQNNELCDACRLLVPEVIRMKISFDRLLSLLDASID